MEYFFIRDLLVLSNSYRELMMKTSPKGQEFVPDLSKQPYTANFGIPFPEHFLRCAEIKLSKDFKEKTGFTPGKRVMLNCPYAIWGLKLEYGNVSSMLQKFNVDENAIPVTIEWTSKSGRIYKITDEDIDCEDIEIRFKDLDLAFVHQHLTSNKKLPFVIKNLSYELDIQRLHVDATVSMYVKHLALVNSEKLITKIDRYIGEFNQNSESKDRMFGVIHNWNRRIILPETIVYTLDMGSTGYIFLKGFLRFLSDLKSFTKVEIA